MVYAESQNDIDKGIQNLENLLNKDFKNKKFQDKIIHELTANQVCVKLYFNFFLHVINLEVLEPNDYTVYQVFSAWIHFPLCSREYRSRDKCIRVNMTQSLANQID